MGIFTQQEKDPKAVKLEIQRKEDEYHEMGRLTKVLFCITVASLIVSVISAIANLAGIGNMKLPLDLVMFALNIFFGVCIIFMPRPEERFRNAGIFYIISSVTTFLDEFSFDMKILVQLGTVIFSLLFIFNFIPEMIERIAPIDEDLENSWRNFLKLYIVCIVAPLLAAFLGIIGFITATLLVLVLYAVIIATLVMTIWNMVLLSRTSTTCISYQYTEPISSKSGFGNRNARNGANRTAGADEWKCTCGKINPNFLGQCTCGVKKSEARAAESRRKALAAEKAKAIRDAAAEKANENAPSQEESGQGPEAGI